MGIEKIHHINFLVKDLQQAMARYRDLLGLQDFMVSDLPGRGVKTARVAVGESWLVLVEPVDPEGVPAQHLAKHGEGFFLLSLAVDDLTLAAGQVVASGSLMTSAEPRQGLENWQVWDIDDRDSFGVQLQLCKEKPPE